MLTGFIMQGFLFFLPAAFGALIRFSLQDTRRAPWYTGGCVLAAAGVWLAARFVPSHGSEGGGILAMILGCLAAGMLLMEGYLYLKELRRTQ